MEWKTIDSAPKTGETILVTTAGSDGAIACMAFWGYCEAEGDVWCLYERMLWKDIPTEGHGLIGWMPNPSHWMPLPQPPKVEK